MDQHVSPMKQEQQKVKQNIEINGWYCDYRRKDEAFTIKYRLIYRIDQHLTKSGCYILTVLNMFV